MFASSIIVLKTSFCASSSLVPLLKGSLALYSIYKLRRLLIKMISLVLYINEMKVS